jgi:hypothetical protein
MTESVFGPRPADRPDDSPDFARVVDAVLWCDGEAIEGSGDVEEIARQLGVEPRVAVYMAKQRVLRSGLSALPARQRAAATALWYEALIIGIKYEKSRAHPAPHTFQT